MWNQTFILTTLALTLAIGEQPLTSKEMEVLEKFKERVRPRTPENLVVDIYLLRFLRAKNFDIPQAEWLLNRNLKWRKENKIDSIVNENFSDMAANYKYHIKGKDREGRIVAFIELGQWDLRQAAISGKTARLLRYMDYYLEKVDRNLRKQFADGKTNSTQFLLITNMDGFNAQMHLCLQCLPMVHKFLSSYESNYPASCEKMFLINTPAGFMKLFEVIKNAVSPVTRQSILVFGTNRDLYLPALLEYIPKDQLPKSIGGSLNLDDD